MNYLYEQEHGLDNDLLRSLKGTASLPRPSLTDFLVCQLQTNQNQSQIHSSRGCEIKNFGYFLTHQPIQVLYIRFS